MCVCHLYATVVYYQCLAEGVTASVERSWCTHSGEQEKPLGKYYMCLCVGLFISEETGKSVLMKDCISPVCTN